MQVEEGVMVFVTWKRVAVSVIIFEEERWKGWRSLVLIFEEEGGSRS
ncbi:hypothetical protein Patl1_29953 [Pistacia atlantica]|uniref:Uncharacterized protein n=1 Tax=Pistacia atlantica TaxID=434234 RepID=A0ACC1ACA3_9ROSI|nr:hypothetical protein Patl1_29953 [Pistacia atlantica]